MATKFLPRPLYPSFTTILPQRFFHKPISLSRLATTAATTTAIFSALDHYGPSLHKGSKPSHLNPSISSELPNHPSPHHTCTGTIINNNNNCGVDESLFDESTFTRIYDIAALRVPSEHCSALESRLRGHLLNWPRIRNIARVPGDDIDVELKPFLKNSSKESLSTLKSKDENDVLSPVLYRDELVKSFNSRGYVKFRNLAKLSRPKKRKKEGDEEGRGGNARRGGVGKNEMVLIEVVEDGQREEDGEDMSGLLGQDFKVGKWRGSTRLLLLDERYVNKRVEDLPYAIKVNVG